MAIIKQFRLFVLLVVFACDFKADEEVFTNIPQPSSAGLSLNLEDISEGTIQLKEKTTFRYTIETADKQLIVSTVRLNDQLIWTTNFASASFDLDPATLATGNYTLKIEFITTTESGSLADKLGAERFVVWLQKTVLVDHNVPSEPGDPGAITITSVQNIDNSIWVHWKEYSSFNFESYQLERMDFDAKGNLVGGKIFPTQQMATQTSQHDYTYVGGKSEYRIKLVADGTTYTSPPFIYEHPYQPELSYELLSGGAVKIKWRGVGTLKNNFGQYTLEIRETVGYANPVTFQLNNASDTSITFNPANFNFGTIKNMSLTISSGEEFHYRKHYGQLIYGKKFMPTDYAMYFNTNDGNFYTSKQHKPYKLNEDGIALDSIDQYFDWPPVFNNTNTAIARLNNANKTYRISLPTMDLEELNLPDAAKGYVYGISDDNKLLTQTETGTKIIGADGTVISSLGSFTAAKTAISPNGKYVIYNDHVYRFDGTQYVDWNILQTHFIKSIDFIPNEPTKAIIGFHDKVIKYNLETNTEELTSNSVTGPCNYDPVSSKIGCHSGNQYVILKSEDLQVYKSIPVSDGIYFLLNETLICTSGAQIKLSELP